MKQSFDTHMHHKFIKYFSIKQAPSRIEKELYTKTKRYLKYIQWIPWLKMIWIWNSLSMHSASEKSDIDLYIVTEKNRLWLVRILVSFIFQILAVRKTGKKHSGRFCLSFFSTLEWMDFSDFVLKNDVYLYFWIVYFKPILDFDQTYETFLQANTSWADFSEYTDYLENNKTYITYQKNTGWTMKISDILLSSINTVLKKIFLPKTLRTYNKLGKPFWVIISDKLLKFHNADIRKKLRETIYSPH